MAQGVDGLETLIKSFVDQDYTLHYRPSELFSEPTNQDYASHYKSTELFLDPAETTNDSSSPSFLNLLGWGTAISTFVTQIY